MSKYQSLFAFRVMKKNDCNFYICLPCFKVGSFCCFTKFIISRISGNFRVSFFLWFIPKFAPATKIISILQGMYFSLKSFLTFLRLPKIIRVKTYLKSRLKNEVAHHCYQMNWWWKLFLCWKLCTWKLLRKLQKLLTVLPRVSLLLMIDLY